jgi:hypothetical protein
MAPQHISDDDLERYYLGHIRGEAELAPLEEHLLSCPACVSRAEASDWYVDLMRRSLMKIGEDLHHYRQTHEKGRN